ncbi:MAG TPA: disulfide bond formation protein B [Acidimicrobiales bacterium]
MVTFFLASLAVVAQAAVAVAAALGIAGRWSAGARRAGARLRAAVAPDALLLALAVAVVSTTGSLYFSERLHFTPCKLCWYQRIAMYPLVPMLAVAVWRRDAGVRRYAMPLALAGGAISAYHVVVERFPSLESGSCDPNNPCSIIWVERFGYLTIPTMALSAFALIVALLLAVRTESEAS